MGFNIVQAFNDHPVVSTFVFVIVFLATLYFVAPSGLRPVIAGFFRVLGHFLSAPFVFVRGIAAKLTSQHDEKESLCDVRQYLLSKLFMVLETILLVVAVGLVASGFVNGCNSMRPDENAAFRKKMAHEQVTQGKKALDLAEDQVDELDKEWKKNKSKWMEETRQEPLKIIETCTTGNKAFEKAFGDNAVATALLKKIRGIFSNGDENIDKAQRIESAKRAYQESDVPQEDADNIWRYIMIHADLFDAKQALAEVNEKNVRNDRQPSYEMARSLVVSAEQEFKAAKREYKEARFEARWRFSRFFAGILLGFLKFIGVVWIAGVCLELMKLPVNVTSDLQIIREHLVLLKKPEASTEAAKTPSKEPPTPG